MYSEYKSFIKYVICKLSPQFVAFLFILSQDLLKSLINILVFDAFVSLYLHFKGGEREVRERKRERGERKLKAGEMGERKTGWFRLSYMLICQPGKGGTLIFSQRLHMMGIHQKVKERAMVCDFM